jgi:hypothetical protein
MANNLEKSGTSKNFSPSIAPYKKIPLAAKIMKNM